MSCTPQPQLPPSMSISRAPLQSPALAAPSDFDPNHMHSIAQPGRAAPFLRRWDAETTGREWKYIVLHHTATNRGSVESIHEAHLQRKDKNGNNWMGIGYHFVIGNGNGMADGAVEPTFRWREQLHGAHAGSKDYNDHGIGIVLIGNFEQAPPSRAQLVAVKQLVGSLKATYGITSNNVVGHGAVKATACPGQYFPMEEIGHALPPTYFGNRPNVPLRVARLERIHN